MSPGSGTDNSSAQCVPQDNGSCVPYSVFGRMSTGLLEEVVNDTGTNLGDVLRGRQGPEGAEEERTPWSIIHLLQANPNRTDVTTDVIDSLDVSNLTHADAESALNSAYQLLLTDNTTEEGVDDRVAALFFKMAHVPFVDVDMLTTYVNGTALIILTEGKKPEKKEPPKQSQGTRLLQSMERILATANISLHCQQREELVLRVTEVNVTQSSSDVMLDVKFHEKKNVIRLARSLFPENEGRVSTVVYGGLRHMLPRNRKGALKGGRVASHVVTVVVHPGKGRKGGHRHQDLSTGGRHVGFLITFTLPLLRLQNPEQVSQRWCVFWKFDMRTWSAEGCWIVAGNGTHATCACSHLSTFAVLVTYLRTPPMSEDHVNVMFVLTAVGCSLSIAGLVLTLFAYIYLRIVLKERVFVHANLALALLLAQTLFVASDTARRHEVACKAVAGLLHFFFLASFCWMLVEGVGLYLTCTRGLPLQSPSSSFSSSSCCCSCCCSSCCSYSRLRQCLLGWGLPLLIVLVSLGLRFPHYGKGLNNSCWLSLERGLIWAFMAPMLIIVGVNVLVMVLVIRVFLALRANSLKSDAARVKVGVRAMVTLLPLLGSTWLLSLLVPFSPVFGYLFILCNSLQGLMMFVLHCLNNEEVRRFLARRRVRVPSHSRTSESNLSVIGWRRSNAAVTFDDVRLGVACGGQGMGHEGRRNAWV